MERNIPKDIINKKKVKSSDIISSLMKRTQTSLTPYESVGKSKRVGKHSLLFIYLFFVLKMYFDKNKFVQIILLYCVQ